MQKLPEDAFALYVSQGADRSHQAVADHYGVSKRTVTRAATRENWTARLAAIEANAQKRSDAKLAQGMAEVRERHLKLLRAMASRAAQAIQAYPLETAMEGMRVAEMTIKLERLIMGEPSERTGISVEQATKQELERLLVVEGTVPEAEDDDGWE